MSYKAEVLLDSISEAGARLTTMEVTFPRIVLAEFNTHRMFSRNSASSRAIPVKKQLERVMTDPFIPVYWGKNQSGMQASAELVGKEREAAIRDWLTARDHAVEQANRLLNTEVHKQITNRLLEPFMWQTVIVSSTEWDNFFALRANKDAQPEIRTVAEMMLERFTSSEPTLIRKGEWHLPLIQPEERDGHFEKSESARKISTARCGRVSYLTHDGKRDLAADITLYERLVTGGHMSPLEHVATPSFYVPAVSDFGDVHSPQSNWIGNFHGWKQLRKFIPSEAIFQG